MNIGAYADMDISNDPDGKFLEYLQKNGFYCAWKKGDDKITLPRQSVWKPFEAKENTKEEQLRVFGIALDQITDLCIAFNKLLADGQPPVIIDNCIILAASPWAGLGIAGTPQREEVKFEGWPDEETQKKFKSFAEFFKTQVEGATDEQCKVAFKKANGLK